MELMEQINNNNDIIGVLDDAIRSVHITELNNNLADIRHGFANKDALDDTERTIAFYKQKLEKIKELPKTGISKRIKLIKMIPYIERLGLTDVDTLSTVLTVGTVLALYDNEPERIKDENLYILSSAFIPVPLKNYNIYKGMVDDELLDEIRDRSDDEHTMRNICYDLFERCELFELSSKDLKKIVTIYHKDNINRIK